MRFGERILNAVLQGTCRRQAPRVMANKAEKRVRERPPLSLHLPYSEANFKETVATLEST